MNKLFVLVVLLSVLISCKSEKKISTEKETKSEVIVTDNFELIKATENSKTVLILFGGFGENPTAIKREFDILTIAKDNNMNVLLMNYSKKLWLLESEKKELAKLLQSTLEKHNLHKKDIFIGGFSSGGVVSLHISNYMLGKKEFYIAPKGVFIADSPIDLLALYKTSQLNIKNNFSDVSVAESTWVLNLFEETIGNPKDSISNYEKYAVFTSESDYTKNLDNLKNTKLRFYTEPDSIWWKENRNREFNQTNAFYIQELSASLKKQNFKNVEYITTENKGYRANGDRHPHSWSIINKENLIAWMME